MDPFEKIRIPNNPNGSLQNFNNGFVDLDYGFPEEFRSNNLDRKGYYKGLINFEKLFKFLSNGVANNQVTDKFDYKLFESNARITVSAREQQNLFATKDFLFFKDREYPVHIPYETESIKGDKLLLQPQTKLFKEIIDTVFSTPDLKITFNFNTEEVFFNLGYRYVKYRNYAIIINVQFYDQFETMLNLSNTKIDDANVKEIILNDFNNALNKAGRDPNQLDWIYEKAPLFVMINQGAKKLILDLSAILKSLVDEIGINEEKVVLKILNALAVIYIKESDGTNLLGNGADTLLKALITNKVNNKTIFERLYSKMNDKGFGEKNFTNLMLFLYKIWYFSSWSNQEIYKNDDTTGVENLAYTNKRILGFNNNDFNFEFKKSKTKKLVINVTKTERVGGSLKDGSGAIVTSFIDEYHPYQPIRLPEIPESGNFVIDNTVIPAFYLKAFDDKGAWENFEKAAWLALDVVTTFTGVGNLLKFRHLLKLRKLAGLTKLQKVLFTLKFAATVVEVTSGTLGIILEFTDNCNSNDKNKKELCQQLRKYLFILDIASLSVDAVVEKLLKKQAKQAIDVAESLIKKSNNVEEIKQLDEVIDSIKKINGIGIYGGKILSKVELEDWAKLLKKKYGTKLELVESLKPGVLADFVANTNTIRYKKGATKYLIAHESFHAEEMFKIKFKEYVKDAAFGITDIDNYTDKNLIRSYKREKYVYDKIVEEAKNLGLTNLEFNHNFFNLDYYILKLEKRNINIPN